MSSHQEIIDAITEFYQQVIRHPYLAEDALKIPPTSGWGNAIDSDGLRGRGKTDAVIELLKHLPYLEASKQYERLLVEYETCPIAYTQNPSIMMEEVNPIPGHCVYLTEGVDREGYSLILDVDKGTITMYSIPAYEISSEFKGDYSQLPRSEQWKVHRTLPAAELLDIWARKYARLVNMLVPNLIGHPTTGTFLVRESNRLKSEQLALQENPEPYEEWRPDLQTLVSDIEDESMKQYMIAQRVHVAGVYNSFLRHGWPDAFDKMACKAEVMELGKRFNVEQNKFMDANDPDAAFFND